MRILECHTWDRRNGRSSCAGFSFEHGHLWHCNRALKGKAQDKGDPLFGGAGTRLPGLSHLGTPASPNQHTPASVPERWRPLVVKKAIRFVFSPSSFLCGGKRENLRTAWQKHYSFGCDVIMPSHGDRGKFRCNSSGPGRGARCSGGCLLHCPPQKSSLACKFHHDTAEWPSANEWEWLVSRGWLGSSWLSTY